MIEATTAAPPSRIDGGHDLVHRRTISPPRSSTAWRSTTISRITSTARSRTTPPCASPAAPPAAASPRNDWYDVGGGESGWIAPDPRNSQIVYAGSYGNLITRQDHRTGQMRNINAWPDNPMGYGADALKYRFQWSFPIAFSPHDPKTLYIGSNVLMKTTNEGQSWEVDQPRSDAQR